MRIKITKLKELPDALNPNNIEEGWSKEFEIPTEYWREPCVGERFYASLSWSTSGIQEIIDDKTFRTYSSIYRWEILENVYSFYAHSKDGIL